MLIAKKDYQMRLFLSSTFVHRGREFSYLKKYPMFQKNSMHIIYSETDHQPRLDAWDKCSGLVHWEDPEEWDGEGGGRGDRDGEYM